MRTATPEAALAVGEATPEFAQAVLRQFLEDLGSVDLTVSGGCMAPALRPGEQVTLVAARRRRPRAGDVVLAVTPAGLRLHRLVWAPPGRAWRTKADRAPTWDAALRDADVLATAVEVRGCGAARPTRSARALLVSWAAVALAHARALARWPRRPR
jgi:hypothetical protein